MAGLAAAAVTVSRRLTAPDKKVLQLPMPPEVLPGATWLNVGGGFGLGNATVVVQLTAFSLQRF